MTTLLRCLALGAVLTLIGCGAAAPVPVAVEGTVTFNGKALESGQAVFVPEDGKVPSTLPITAGKYAGNVLPGKYKIQLNAFKKIPNPVTSGPGGGGDVEMNIIPARYNAESKETREVTAAGPNKFDFGPSSP